MIANCYTRECGLNENTKIYKETPENIWYVISEYVLTTAVLSMTCAAMLDVRANITS